MLIYKDVLTGDEICSDAFPTKVVHDGLVMEVDCQMIQIKQGADVDIGANPSAEEQEEALEEGAVMMNNVVYSFRLQETSFDKSSYVTYIKGYMKKLKEHLQSTKPERVADFEKGAQNFVKSIVKNFKDYEFYIGESMDPEGMVLLLNYREDGVTPYFSVFVDGLKEEKQ